MIKIRFTAISCFSILGFLKESMDFWKLMMFSYRLKQIKRKKIYTKCIVSVFIITTNLMCDIFTIKCLLPQLFSFSLKTTTSFYVNVNYISVWFLNKNILLSFFYCCRNINFSHQLWSCHLFNLQKKVLIYGVTESELNK